MAIRARAKPNFLLQGLAVVIIETDGNKMTRVSHYIDVAGMMAQLGVSGATLTSQTGTRA